MLSNKIAMTGLQWIFNYSSTSSAKMIGVILGIIMVVLSVIAWLQQDDTLPIRFVRVSGVFQNLERSQLEHVLASLTSAGYFSIKLSDIQSETEILPWVDSVRIKRIWPDALGLHLIEQVPYARWGAESLLNPRGERFIPANLEDYQFLPLIKGPTGSEEKLTEIFKMLKHNLARHGLRIVSCEVDDLDDWSIQLDGGMAIKLGRHDPLVKFARFLRALPTLGNERIDEIQRVDLRYTNGFAVAWKSGEGLTKTNGNEETGVMGRA